MPELDYYQILEIERTVTQEEIAASYRRAAMKYHPDRNAGDKEAVEKFKLAAEAYEVLKDPEMRSIYDRYGKEGVKRTGGGAGFQDVSDIFGAFGDIFGDTIFGSFFGGGRSSGSRVRRGADIRCSVTLDLHEVAKGVSREIRYRRHELCDACQGSGAKAGTKPEVCRYCGGRGRIQKSNGIFSIQTPCPKCQGRGKIIVTPCTVCHGAGMVEKDVVREVRIPAGIDSGVRLRMQGEGHRSPDGGPAGDCYVFIQVKQHPFFRRDGQDLVCQIPIKYTQAVLGAEAEVPTLDGVDKVRIPAGTQNGDVIRLKGRGMPLPRRNLKGDLLVQVFIEVPRGVSPKYQAELKKLAEVEGETGFAQRKNFFDALRQFMKDYFGKEGPSASETKTEEIDPTDRKSKKKRGSLLKQAAEHLRRLFNR
ncbi:MAG: molecular chaperone DnaJ [Thermoguttaceae bacterium]|jgi:molecular chaperone DnaJ